MWEYLGLTFRFHTYMHVEKLLRQCAKFGLFFFFGGSAGLLYIYSGLDAQSWIPLPSVSLPLPPSCASEREEKERSEDREMQTGVSPCFNAITGMSASQANAAINILSSRHHRAARIHQGQRGMSDSCLS